VLIALGIVIVVLLMISVGSWLYYKLTPVTLIDPPPAPLPILTQPIVAQAGVAPPAEVVRGRYLTIAGDCVSCHTRAGGMPFTGGRGIRTPFGIIYSPNLSGSAAGIAGWTPAQFFRALHEGIADDGSHLYPALPYTHFTVISRADSDAILTWLKTVPGDASTPPSNRLPFPLDLRPVMIAWNALNFAPHPYRTNSTRSAEWQRGAYLVDGLGHCGSCHTPKTMLGADDASRRFYGGNIDNWVAPDLTANARSGLGNWSADEIAEYLKAGRNARSNAGGPMAEVVAYSTSLMSDADRDAIATYLKSLPAGPATTALSPAAAAITAGAAIYGDACSACHRVDGKGSPALFPPLGGSAALQQADAANVIRVILGGARTAPTLIRPSTPSMPSFAWKLGDQQIADVATYVRNSWGNHAKPVSESDVERLRRQLKLRPAMTAIGTVVGGRTAS
jgi:mono/diheme cytochrome c family protein